MESEWKEYTVDEFADVVGGGTPSTEDARNFGGNIPWITPKDLSNYNFRHIQRGERNITERGLNNSNAALLPTGTVLLSSRAPVGYLAIAANPVTTNQGFKSLVVRNGFDSEFVYYLLKANVEYLKSQASGTTFGELSGGTLKKLKFTLPPFPIQRAITSILGTLDDKIELNQRMNGTLEVMARAIFKSWFVDFDPVRAKAENRDPGLPKHIADLFPDRFKDSELGEIPAGWKVGTLGDVVKQLRDQENPLSSPDLVFSHYSIPAFDEGQQPKLEYGESIKSLKFRVPAGTVLLSKLNPEIERVWLVDVQPGERAVCSTEFLVLSSRTPFTRAYVYFLARSQTFRQQIEALVTGTSKSHQRAQADVVLTLDIIVPPAPITEAFDETASELLDRTLTCRRESRTLATLRDTLLPKLISGELRIPDAERIVGRVV